MVHRDEAPPTHTPPRPTLTFNDAQTQADRLRILGAAQRPLPGLALCFRTCIVARLSSPHSSAKGLPWAWKKPLPPWKAPISQGMCACHLFLCVEMRLRCIIDRREMVLFPKVQGPAQPEGKKTRQVQSFQVGRLPIRCVPWKHIPTACHLDLVPPV